MNEMAIVGGIQLLLEALGEDEAVLSYFNA